MIRRGRSLRHPGRYTIEMPPRNSPHAGADRGQKNKADQTPTTVTVGPAFTASFPSRKARFLGHCARPRPCAAMLPPIALPPRASINAGFATGVPAAHGSYLSRLMAAAARRPKGHPEPFRSPTSMHALQRTDFNLKYDHRSRQRISRFSSKIGFGPHSHPSVFPDGGRGLPPPQRRKALISRWSTTLSRIGGAKPARTPFHDHLYNTGLALIRDLVPSIHQAPLDVT